MVNFVVPIHFKTWNQHFGDEWPGEHICGVKNTGLLWAQVQNGEEQIFFQILRTSCGPARLLAAVNRHETHHHWMVTVTKLDKYWVSLCLLESDKSDWSFKWQPLLYLLFCLCVSVEKAPLCSARLNGLLFWTNCVIVLVQQAAGLQLQVMLGWLSGAEAQTEGNQCQQWEEAKIAQYTVYVSGKHSSDTKEKYNSTATSLLINDYTHSAHPQVWHCLWRQRRKCLHCVN